MPGPAWLSEAMKKYRQKLNHVKLRPQLMVLIPTLQNKTAIALAQNDMIVSKIRAVLNAEGILSDYSPPYIAYGLALDKSQRKLEFMVDRIREHQILRARWQGRGLNASVLDKLDARLIFSMTQP
jgi:hypothetical protein